MKLAPLSSAMTLLMLAVFLAGTLLFILPTRDQVASISAQKTQLAADVGALGDKITALKALSDQVGQSEATQNGLKAALPVGMAQDELILDVSALAQSTGFVLNSLNFSQGSDDLGPTLLLTANVSGTYDKLLEFLQKLENGDRLIRVVSMSVQRTSTTDVVFSIQMEALYQNKAE